MSKEQARLDEAREKKIQWRKWGPYLSERQWGTVREDYSKDGNAWDYFSHDQARSRAYRWGEDGLAGISDDQHELCFALALWNGRDPILKERLFGLTNSEGNHGEDVKEYYFYLDSTPTHSYLKWLYKYPQAAFPYDDLVRTNRGRSRDEMEYELVDTGVFKDNRYFDVFVEYAKAGPEDVLIRITAHNRGPEAAKIHLLPTLWFRNTWGWKKNALKPQISRVRDAAGGAAAEAIGPDTGRHFLCAAGQPEWLFTENETNRARVFGQPNPEPYVKDAFHEYLVNGRTAAVNPAQTGTKAAAHYQLNVAGGQSATVCLRLAAVPGGASAPALGAEFEAVFEARRAEADEFYREVLPARATADEANVMRQALAGMLWSKQYFGFNLHEWLLEHGVNPLQAARGGVRNRDWFHMVNKDVISMPDKWEYPWYAAWDLAFHTVALGMVDLDFAKKQLDLMLKDRYLHPNGQIPAYEWNFSDVNPPVHAWASVYLYHMEKRKTGRGDVEFLKRTFGKLLMNFTWWVNRKDPAGRNVFNGGFLGLDNIGVFDRSSPLPTGGHLEQADGTAWMAFFCQCMLDIALELAQTDKAYEELAQKFVEHFFWIAYAMDRMGEHEDEMWDEPDGFFYDLLKLPDGRSLRLKVRSMVGLLPLCATCVFEPETRASVPELMERVTAFLDGHPELRANVWPEGPTGRTLLSVVSPDKLPRLLAKLLDEAEFLGPCGIRSLSKFHERQPYVFDVQGQSYRVDYLPAESNTGMFGGNSNWRGPVWMPVNILIVRALLQFHAYYGDAFRIECPTDSGKKMNLFEVAGLIAGRLGGIFLKGPDGRRPVYGGTEAFQNDPHWRDLVLFYEYFHGDNGAGLGASHQTGWTGLVAPLLDLFRRTDARSIATNGVKAGAGRKARKN